MNLSIGMTPSFVQSKTAIKTKSNIQKQVYSSNTFTDFSNEKTRTQINDAILCINQHKDSPSFKGSTTA